MGLWAGILSILHTAVGQNVHLRGRPWLYYVYEHRAPVFIPLRHDLFGFANFTGALGAVIIVALLATSNDHSLRALGTPRWKQHQRWSYAAFSFVAAHSIAYQVNEKQASFFVMIATFCIVTTATLQIAGLINRRGTAARRSKLRSAQPERVGDH